MTRWVRLSVAMVVMILIGNLQYSWTLFVQPIVAATGWKLSEVQWGFTFFVALGTWAMPLSGWLIDRMGPRAFIGIAGLLCGVGWASMGFARSLAGFYGLYSLAGLGVAFAYCGAVSLALKWFPDRRGLAAGLIVAGYGSGAALCNPLFAHLIRATNYRTTLLWTGIAQGLLILISSACLRNPPKGAVSGAAAAKPRVRRHLEEFTGWEMLQTPQFYVLYGMMLMVGIGGLMATAQVAPVAASFGVGATGLGIALSLNPLANGGGRIFWGWVSDHLGREQTMFAAFLLQAVFLASVATVGRWGQGWFVLSVALVFFTWGELYVLFPAVLADLFGARHAATNYSILYSTKGVASILAGGLAAELFEKTGTWNYGFYGSAALALGAALAAIGLLRMPVPKKHRAAGAEVAARDGLLRRTLARARTQLGW
jgi:OFA family oxalate/formate antiporter-like MFS transporter